MILPLEHKSKPVPRPPAVADVQKLKTEVDLLETQAALLERKKIAMDRIALLLGEIQPGPDDFRAMALVIAPVLEHVPLEDLRAQDRRAETVALRRNACVLLRAAGYTNRTIGKFLHREHTGIHYLLGGKIS